MMPPPRPRDRAAGSSLASAAFAFSSSVTGGSGSRGTERLDSSRARFMSSRVSGTGFGPGPAPVRGSSAASVWPRQRPRPSPGRRRSSGSSSWSMILVAGVRRGNDLHACISYRSVLADDHGDRVGPDLVRDTPLRLAPVLTLQGEDDAAGQVGADPLAAGLDPVASRRLPPSQSSSATRIGAGRLERASWASPPFQASRASCRARRAVSSSTGRAAALPPQPRPRAGERPAPRRGAFGMRSGCGSCHASRSIVDGDLSYECISEKSSAPGLAL
jgi:hypothetical protein